MPSATSSGGADHRRGLRRRPRLLGEPDRLDHLVRVPRFGVIRGRTSGSPARSALSGRRTAPRCPGAPATAGRPGQGPTRHPHLAGVPAPVPLADLYRRGLSRAVGAEQREDLAAADLQVQPVDGHGSPYRFVSPRMEIAASGSSGSPGCGRSAHAAGRAGHEETVSPDLRAESPPEASRRPRAAASRMADGSLAAVRPGGSASVMRSRIRGRGWSSVAIPNAPSSASSARWMRGGVVGLQLQQRLPGRHLSPGPARQTTPAPADTGSSLRARPAPSRHAAMPSAYASSGSARRWPARTTCVSADRQRRVRVAALGGDHPPPHVHRRPVGQGVAGSTSPRPAPRASPGPAPGSARRRRPAPRPPAPRPTRPPRRRCPPRGPAAGPSP